MFKKIHEIPLPFVTIDVLEHDGKKVNVLSELPGFRITASIKEPSVNGLATDYKTSYKDLYLNFSNEQPITCQHDVKLTFPEDVNLNDEEVKKIDNAKHYLVESLRYSFELGGLSKLKFGNATIEAKMPTLTKVMIDALWNSIFHPFPTGSKLIFDPDDMTAPPRILLDLGNGVWFHAQTSKRTYKKNPYRVYGHTKIFDQNYLFSFRRDPNVTLFKDLVSNDILRIACEEAMELLEKRMGNLKIPRGDLHFINNEQ